jgi:hypothetical protein
MKTLAQNLIVPALVVLFALCAFPFTVRAHCDGLDGPVVKAAQKALVERNIDLVLLWVNENTEAELKSAFEKTLVVRQLNAEARELADRYFFETLVRLHRAGEGAPYTGLKPAGRDLGPAIPAADKALETGTLEPLVHFLSEATEQNLRRRFNAALEKKKKAPGNVEAGRAFVRAYVDYIHYVERLHEAAASAAHGHFGSAEANDAVAPSSGHAVHD